MTVLRSQADGERLARLSEELAAARAGWGELGTVALDAGHRFPDGEPLRVWVRKRGIRYDIDDAGVAVHKAGKPPGWREAVERVAREHWLNANRAGVVFVQGFERRDWDLPELAFRIGDLSLAVYEELLELTHD